MSDPHRYSYRWHPTTPSSIDITLLVDEAIDQDIDEHCTLLHKFYRQTAQVAIQQHHEYGRGFVFGQEVGQESCEERRLFYIASGQPSPDPKLRWRPPVRTEQKIHELLTRYCPNSEAILVLRLPSTLQVYLIDQTQPMKIMSVEELNDAIAS